MSNWQPIETAPKDGTVILGYILGFNWGITAAVKWVDRNRWELDGVVWGDESSDADPTHWMPLPEPPK